MHKSMDDWMGMVFTSSGCREEGMPCPVYLSDYVLYFQRNEIRNKTSETFRGCKLLLQLSLLQNVKGTFIIIIDVKVFLFQLVIFQLMLRCTVVNMTSEGQMFNLFGYLVGRSECSSKLEQLQKFLTNAFIIYELETEFVNLKEKVNQHKNNLSRRQRVLT